MQMMLAAAFSWMVIAISEMAPGFTLESRADRAVFFMVAWLCGYQLLQKNDK